MNFDMNTCWSRAVELVQANFSLLIVIAGALIMLPTLALYLLMPDMQMFADPMADQSVVQERMAEILAPFFGAMLVISLFQFAGQGAMVALMGDHRPTVGQALAQGVKVVPSLLAVMILVMLALFIGAVVVMLPFIMIGGAIGGGGEALSLLAIPIILVGMGWMMARLSMTLPAMVLGETLNPVTSMLASYRMTGPKQWMIFLFWVVLYVVIVIINVLVTGVVGVVAALMATGTASLAISGLVNGLVGGIISMVFCAVAVAMYYQLTSAPEDSIRDTFD